jgi:hypothetical protein
MRPSQREQKVLLSCSLLKYLGPAKESQGSNRAGPDIAYLKEVTLFKRGNFP